MKTEEIKRNIDTFKKMLEILTTFLAILVILVELYEEIMDLGGGNSKKSKIEIDEQD